jgi:hypothetical protein
MSKSYSAENPPGILELRAKMELGDQQFNPKKILEYSIDKPLKKLFSGFDLIQSEMNTDETMDMQPIVKEREKLGYISTCKEGQVCDCALNTLVYMGILDFNEANYFWNDIKDKGLTLEHIRLIYYYYYHKKYNGRYMPSIYRLRFDVGTEIKLKSVLETLHNLLNEDHYTYIAGIRARSIGHAFIVGKKHGKLVFNDPQGNSGMLSEDGDQEKYQKFMNELKQYIALEILIEQDVGLEILRRARKPKPSPRKTSKTRKRKRGRTPSLRRRKSNSLPSLKKRKHEHDYGIFPNTPGGFHPGVRRKTNKKRKNAKKKTQKRKRK